MKTSPTNFCSLPLTAACSKPGPTPFPTRDSSRRFLLIFSGPPPSRRASPSSTPCATPAFLRSTRVLGALGYSVEVTQAGQGLSRKGTPEDSLISPDVWRKLLVKMEQGITLETPLTQNAQALADALEKKSAVPDPVKPVGSNYCLLLTVCWRSAKVSSLARAVGDGGGGSRLC